MWLIGLIISLFNIIKIKVLEYVPVVNQKCMPRPKILDVNEGVGEALFYPYNVLVNKCSESCNVLDNPMTKLCAPNVIKRVSMQVYNFLMRLNETRNVLWHENCVINETMTNNQDDITNNTYLSLFIIFLIEFIYYCRRSNFDRKKLRDFIYPKVKASVY